MKRYLLSILLSIIACQNNKGRTITMETEFGLIKLKLFSDNAPVTVKNFLKYVHEKRYDDFHFYRSVNLKNQLNKKIKIEVIQGGLGLKNHPMRLEPIAHESTNITGLKHLNGSLSMARVEPGSASSEIFICINDQPELDYGGKRNPDGQGFAVFGKVLEGLEIIKLIHNQKSEDQMLKKPIFIKFMNKNL
jgi:peptidyl-prolyl cis-trans isomerase A (cyclophilin A)